MYLFDKLSELKEKFKSFFVSKKKLKALENYAEVAPFQHRSYIGLIKKCMNDGFLGEKETDFLSYMIDKCEINFLDWAHKTKWLKKEMRRVAAVNRQPSFVQASMFDRLENNPSMNVPLHLLNEASSKGRIGARV